jgi:hypothetical protein
MEIKTKPLKMTVPRRMLKPGDLITLEFAFSGLIKAKVIGAAPGGNRVTVRVTSGAPGYRLGMTLDVNRCDIRFRDKIRVRGGQFRITPWPFDCEWDESPVSCGISDVYYI